MVKDLNWRDRFDFSRTESQAFMVHSVRFVFLLLVLFITLSFQFLEKRIDALDAFLPLYGLIGFSLFVQITYFFLFKKVFRNRIITSFLFFFEAFYVTGLIYFIGIQQSVLIFLYLVNLILCGVLFQRKGALALALWTSVLFSFIISMDLSLTGNTAYLAVGVNNLAFFTVAYLSGFLSEQLNIMGEQLKEKVRDVATLKNLNDLILKNIGSGLVTVDNQKNILQANPKAFHLLGYTGELKEGTSFESLMPGLDFERAEPEKEFDHFYKREGERRVFNIRMSPLYDDTGLEQGQIIRFQDETHLRALEKRVRQSEKMAAIGQLATGIAHEIRNPLAGISGSIQLMQADNSDLEQNTKLMGIVEREIVRLNNLITEFLDFAKPEAPMEDQVALGLMVEEILNFIKTDGEKKTVQTELHIDESLKILGNRDKLKQAFLNILVNSFQALESSQDPKIRVAVKKNGNYALVSISDNGVGISEELKDRIFEPFHTTKHKGTGLGLAITHSIFESHSAQVLVESELGVGTEFKISFKLIS